MVTDWTEKYRPRSLDDVLGNPKAVESLRRWAHGWDFAIPTERAVILAGSPGTGKTSAAIALANDMGWGVIELNASDVRNADRIRSIATRGALFETFTDTGEYVRSRDGGKKLIILDEADNLYERIGDGGGKDATGTDFSDRGGKAAITETIRITMQPMILIVNDLYALTRNSTLKRLCQVIRFQKVPRSTIEKALTRIIRNEGIEVEREAMEFIAQRADGDMRAAINDLQALSMLGTTITADMAGDMGFRDNVITLQEAIDRIFKGTTTEVRKAAWDLDDTPENLLMWLDENLPHAYRDIRDLKRGYDALSRADVHLGRVRKRQYYRLWAHANDMMTAGVALAKHREYHHYVGYRFPEWIMKMSRTKGIRKMRNDLAAKIGVLCHTSIQDARLELLPLFQTIFQGTRDTRHDFAVAMTRRLSLEPEEIAFLLGVSTEDDRIRMIRDMAEERHRETTGFFPSRLGTKKATAAGMDIHRKKETKKRTENKAKRGRKKASGDGKDDPDEGDTGEGNDIGEGNGTGDNKDDVNEWDGGGGDDSGSQKSAGKGKHPMDDNGARHVKDNSGPLHPGESEPSGEADIEPAPKKQRRPRQSKEEPATPRSEQAWF